MSLEQDRTGYSPDLYVPRMEINEEIRKYSQDEQNALLSLMGAPGTGKSWLLQDIAKDTRNLLPEGSRALLYQAGELLGAFKNNHLDLKRKLIETANSIGLDFPLDLVPTLSAIVLAIGQHARKNNAQTTQFILIDGWDELARDQDFADLQEAVRSTFLQGTPGFFRVIMARRRPLTNYYLKQIDRGVLLDVFDVSEADQQKATIAPGLDLSLLLPPTANYQWNHPFINAYLWSHATPGQALGADLLRACCLELVNRPSIDSKTATRFPPLTADEIILYSRWAFSLDKHWSAEAFKDQSRRRLQPADLERGIVVVTNPPLYTFAPGLRELLQDIVTLERGS